MKWIFACLQVSWLGEKEITRYYGRGSSSSISRQPESRKSLQSSEKAWSPKTARSKGARNSQRSEPCLFQLLQKGGGHRIYPGLCLPGTKVILKYCANPGVTYIIWWFSTALTILHYWNGNGNVQVCFPKLMKSLFCKRCFWKKV